MNKQQFLELYAKFAWPWLRHFVRISKRCKQCLLSEAYGPLSMGLCRHCSDLNQITNDKTTLNHALESDYIDKFDRKMQSSVGTDRKYDALLMLSGGKDSAYILDKIRRDYPNLKILALFVNNGFSSQFAVRNAHHIAEKTHTDLMVSNSQILEFSEVFRYAFLSLNGRGSYGVVDFADGEMIFSIGQRVAQDFGIPLIIGGLSWVQVQMIVGSDSFELVKDTKPTIIFPLAVWRTNEREIIQIVRDGQLLLPGSESPIVSNNDLILAMSAIDILNLGYCSFEPEFAQLIREGKTDRKTWLYLFELLEYATKKGFLKTDVESALKKLNLTVRDIVKES